MMKDDYLNFAVFGKTDEERKVGNVLITLSEMLAKPKEDLATHEVFIGAFPQMENIRISRERYCLLQAYWKAQHDWDQTHALESGDKDGDRFEKMHADVDPAFNKELTRIKEISDTFDKDKRHIFTDLAVKFETLMRQLFSSSLLASQTDNYVLARQIQKYSPAVSNDARLARSLDQYCSRLIDCGVKYVRNPRSEETLDGLKKLPPFFGKHIAGPLTQKTGTDPEFVEDIYSGKMGSFYFTGIDEFFKHFAWHAIPNQREKPCYIGKGRHISFSLSGMLGGDYHLAMDSILEFTRIGCRQDFSSVMSASPVYLKTSVSSSFSPIVTPFFDGLRKSYGRQAIPATALVPYDSGKSQTK